MFYKFFFKKYYDTISWLAVGSRGPFLYDRYQPMYDSSDTDFSLWAVLSRLRNGISYKESISSHVPHADKSVKPLASSATIKIMKNSAIKYTLGEEWYRHYETMKTLEDILNESVNAGCYTSENKCLTCIYPEYFFSLKKEFFYRFTSSKFQKERPGIRADFCGSKQDFITILGKIYNQIEHNEGEDILALIKKIIERYESHVEFNSAVEKPENDRLPYQKRVKIERLRKITRFLDSALAIELVYTPCVITQIHPSAINENVRVIALATKIALDMATEAEGNYY